MRRYPTNQQLKIYDLTIVKGFFDRKAARRLRKSNAAVKQARYRLKQRVKKDQVLAAAFT